MNASETKGSHAPFMSLLGHELRSPLTQILAYVEALEDDVYGALAAAQREPLTQIRSGAHRALALVKRVVQIDRLQKGAIPAPAQVCHALPHGEAAFRQAQEVFEFPARFVWIYVPSAEDTRDALRTTPALFEQLVAELLGCVAASVSGGRIAFRMGQDFGAGVLTLRAMSATAQHTEELNWSDAGQETTAGEAMKRLQSLRPTSFALVELLAQLHGGSITASENHHGGVSLAVHLPLADPSAPVAPSSTVPESQAPVTPAPSTTISGAKILLADDEPFLLAVMQDHLENSGYQVITCDNGKQALLDAEAHHPDLLIIDVQMPQMGGLEVIRRIRQGQSPLAQVPILCLSGMGTPGDRDICLSAGANSYLTKPFSVKEINRIVAELLASRAADS